MHKKNQKNKKSTFGCLIAGQFGTVDRHDSAKPRQHTRLGASLKHSRRLCEKCVPNSGNKTRGRSHSHEKRPQSVKVKSPVGDYLGRRGLILAPEIDHI